MGTKEQSNEVSAAAANTHNRNANTTTTTRQQRSAQPPQVVIIPATQASTVATNAAKKIRRAFSMPRNPFRWSRKFKTSTAGGGGSDGSSRDGDGGSNSALTSCVGGGGRSGSIVSLSSYEAVVCKDLNGGATVVGEGANAERMANGKQRGGGGGGFTGSASAANVNGGGSSSNRVLRRSSFRKFLNRIAQHVSTSVNVGANKHASAQAYSMSSTLDRVPPIGGYQWPADQTPGVMGLKNHGNTCFMNAVLQCLSHTDILAEYFVLDQYKADLKRRNKINSRKFGTKGELTEQLANVLKALWTCKNESDHSTSFKAVVDRYGSQFRSSTQHDAQEFLFWLLDKVHEDLNSATKRRYKNVKNNYGRPDEVIAAETLANHIRCNNSFVQAVFQAQFRSSLTCPRCCKQSNTFDPFHCISVQLPQLTQQTIFVTVVYRKQQPHQVKLGLTVPAGSPIVALREQLRSDTGIASERMVLADIGSEGFSRVFYDTQPVATLNGIETIYCIEVPELKAPVAASQSQMTTKTSESVEAAKDAATTAAATSQADLLLLVANVRKRKKTLAKEEVDKVEETSAVTAAVDAATTTTTTLERFGTPFSMQAPRDCSYAELQKKLLREMSPLLKPEVFSYATPLTDMFQIRLQDPSADPDTFLEKVEHPLLTEMIDLALSVLSAEAGPPHIKLLLEWNEPEQHFADLSDTVVEHESVARLASTKPNDTAALTLEQCLEHYTKAETLSAEDAWRCPHCQQYLPVVKTLGLWSLPDILVVHFKRFRQHQVKGANSAKLTTMVKFPLHAFDMAPHLARGPNDDDIHTTTTNSHQHDNHRPSTWKRNGGGDSRSSTLNSCDSNARLETRYDLYAVCYHQGDTLETGHYTAACKNPYDRQWYKFDDQRVGKVSGDDIHAQIINNEAYMLFYQKRGSANDIVECSASSSNSGGDHWVSRIAPPVAASVVEKLPAASELAGATEAAIVASSASDVAAPKLPASLALPEKSETQPVEIPKVHEEAKEAASAIVASKETTMSSLAEMVVNETKNDLVDITEIDFADADAIADDDDDDDELLALEKLATKAADMTNADDENQIFVMDEDCQINDDANDDTKESIKDATKPPPQSQTDDAATATRTTNTKSSPIPTAAATTIPIPPRTESTSLHPATTNGHTERASKSPNGSISPHDIKSHSASNTSSAASSASSLSSSRSSPHSLAVSVHAASTLQTKFNGFSASSSSTNHHYKEPLLSSSLKSNSSSIIGAAAVSSAHEFALSRHHYQQNQHWNGSRSSVSAVESSGGGAQQHAATHCLNLRHSFSTSSNYKLRDCSETLSSMLRNSANTCSKDTLIFIDQQNHHHHHHRGAHHHNHHQSLMEDDDDTFMGSRSLWISPVTPHKLITVSPKN